MSAMECEECGKACSKIIIEIGRSYIRLCKECYEKISDKKISDFVDDEEPILWPWE
jgi:ribosome-binding protein aMBF1 (putative translation factor)